MLQDVEVVSFLLVVMTSLVLLFRWIRDHQGELRSLDVPVMEAHQGELPSLGGTGEEAHQGELQGLDVPVGENYLSGNETNLSDVTPHSLVDPSFIDGQDEIPAECPRDHEDTAGANEDRVPPAPPGGRDEETVSERGSDDSGIVEGGPPGKGARLSRLYEDIDLQLDETYSKVVEIKQRLDTLTLNRDAVQSNIDQVENNLSQYQDRMQKLEQGPESKDNSFAIRETGVKVRDLQSDRDELRTRLWKTELELERHRKTVDHAQAYIERLKQEKENIEHRQQALDDQNAALRDAVDKLKSQLDQNTVVEYTKHNQIEAHFRQVIKEIEKQRDQCVETMTSQIDKLQRQNVELCTEVTSLKEDKLHLEMNVKDCSHAMEELENTNGNLRSEIQLMKDKLLRSRSLLARSQDERKILNRKMVQDEDTIKGLRKRAGEGGSPFGWVA